MSEFYEPTAMGAGFDHNPVVAVQIAQLKRWEAGRTTHDRVRVLDLGCGAGTPTRLLMNDADRFQVFGADLSSHAIETYVRTTGRSAVRLDAQRLPFADRSFDLVVSDDVIEHLVDTDAYIREIRRVLVDGGHLFLSTPNLAAWFNRLGLLIGVQPAFSEVSFEKIFGRPGAEIVGHLRLFTARSIREFLVHHGFDVVDARGASFAALPRPARALDRLLARSCSLAGNSVIVAKTTARRSPS
jgi:SAM-dependent methyltransferase